MTRNRWPDKSFGLKLRERGTERNSGCDLGQRHTGGFGDKGHRAAGTRVHLDNEDLVIFDGVLDVDQPDDAQGFRKGQRVRANLVDDTGAQRCRGNDTRAVSRVDACLFDVLHDAADQHRTGAVTDGVDIDLGGTLKKTIDEDWPLR